MPQQKIANKEKIWMPTPVQQKLRDKTITAKKWADMVKPGDWINRGGPGSDTTVLHGGPGCPPRRRRRRPEQHRNLEPGDHARQRLLRRRRPEGKYHVLHEAFILPTPAAS